MRTRVTVTTRPQVVQRAAGTVLLAAAVQPQLFMLAAFELTLVRTEHGCVALGDSEFARVVQCPFGTTLSDDGQSIDVPGLGAIRFGDTVRGSGGLVEPDPADLPAECGTVTDVFFWQRSGPT